MFSASKYLPKRSEPRFGLVPRLGAYRPVGLFSSQHFSKHLTTLSKALASVSTNLSIAALLGLALVPLLPHHAASILAHRAYLPVPASAAPIEVVRAKPVPVPDAQATAKTPLTGAARELYQQQEAAVQLAARRSREPLARLEPESGDMGKPGAGAQASKTPIPPADPKSEAAKVEPPPDVWSDAEIIAALRDCLKRLAPLGAEVDIAPPVKHEQCGAPAPVLLKRIGSGPNRVEFQPPPMLNCAMVTSLQAWVEKTLQPAAQEVLGSPIARLRSVSGYACRNRNGSRSFTDRLSEHALANAIDIAGFVTADGRTIDVVRNWGPTARDMREQQEKAEERAAQAKAAAKQAEREAAEAARAVKKEPASKRERAKAEADRLKQEAERLKREAEQREADRRKGLLRIAELQNPGRGADSKADARAIPTTATSADSSRPAAETVFLRRLHKGACATFGTVLGPEANDAHRDHFHFDLAPRRRSAFCE